LPVRRRSRRLKTRRGTLVESPRGSIEVAPGEIIPGAGAVKSIERRGAGWIVITSRGLVDSAGDSYQP
jgi:hypothetical protein